jgi:hypothetical protein
MKFKTFIITIALVIGLSNVLMSEDLSSKTKSTGTESLFQHNVAYFIGEWVGEWVHNRGRQEANFLIKEEKDGNYRCTYSWGFFQSKMSTILPGSTSGIIFIENDNTIKFINPNYTISLIKLDDNTLKALRERVGPSGGGYVAFIEGYFKRVK